MMRLLDVFTKTPTISADDARRTLDSAKADEINLIDVREPDEYERGHLPGAVSIPLSVLPDRMGEIDRAKPAITYCGSGVRSRSAASLMSGAGIDARSMSGGMKAWEGRRATGGPEAGMFLLKGKDTPEELIALAIALEDGTRVFYEAAMSSTQDAEAREIYRRLSIAEQKHRRNIMEAYVKLRPGEHLRELEGFGYMEGGVSVEEAINWVETEGRTLPEVLEASMQLEVNALDFYMKFKAQTGDKAAEEVLNSVIEDEKAHLAMLGALIEKKS